MMRSFGCTLAALSLLTGCPTRELVLQNAEAPWAGESIESVAMPNFESPPTGWAMADQARRILREALDRGTVRVVEPGREPTAALRGAVASFKEHATPGAPRRVLRNAGSSAGNLPSASYNETFGWEMDVTHGVQLTVVLRLENVKGNVVWTKEAFGDATETRAIALNWPGSDPVAPPALLSYPAEPALLQRLRERALAQALEPLVQAVTVRYAYKDVR